MGSYGSPSTPVSAADGSPPVRPGRELAPTYSRLRTEVLGGTGAVAAYYCALDALHRFAVASGAPAGEDVFRWGASKSDAIWSAWLALRGDGAEQRGSASTTDADEASGTNP